MRGWTLDRNDTGGSIEVDIYVSPQPGQRGSASLILPANVSRLKYTRKSMNREWTALSDQSSLFLRIRIRYAARLTAPSHCCRSKLRHSSSDLRPIHGVFQVRVFVRLRLGNFAGDCVERSGLRLGNPDLARGGDEC